MENELFPIVDENGNVTGSATRKECHSGSMLLHPVVHLHVFDKSGNLYLQHRSPDKDIQPDKWDTSVGGHVDFGETIEEALLREAREELGLITIEPHFLYKYIFQSEIERELVHTYFAICEQKDIKVDHVEISEGKFLTMDEIHELITADKVTPNFRQELNMLRDARQKLNKYIP